MMTFDDFVIGMEQFGTRILPLMKCRSGVAQRGLMAVGGDHPALSRRRRGRSDTWGWPKHPHRRNGRCRGCRSVRWR